MIKRGSRALIGAKAASFDERGVKTKVSVGETLGKEAFAFGTAVPVVKEEDMFEDAPSVDWAKLERDVMIS